MEESTFNYLSTVGDFTIDYAIFGDGPQILLAFHGFGRSYDDFKFLTPFLKTNYTIYGVNIFHHGKSAYPQGRISENTLSNDELAKIFGAFVDQLGIDRFSLMGYSLGGKVALSITEYLATRVDNLVLVAPDGIHINKWYKFAALNPIGRTFARGVVKRPKPFFRLADFLKWSKIVPPHLHRFAYIHLETHEKRKLVYDVWMTFRKVDPDIPKIQSLINEHAITCSLIFGKYDRVIPPHIGKRFAAGLDQENALKIMESGHILLNDELGDYLRSTL